MYLILINYDEFLSLHSVFAFLSSANIPVYHEFVSIGSIVTFIIIKSEKQSLLHNRYFILRIWQSAKLSITEPTEYALISTDFAFSFSFLKYML